MSTAEPFLLRFWKALKESIKVQCKGVLADLRAKREAGELLSSYVQKWNAYCAAISKLDYSFGTFSAVLNQIYDEKWESSPRNPPFTVMRMMVIMWRRVVLNEIKEDLLEALVILYQNIRNNLVKNCPHFCGNKQQTKVEPEVLLMQS